MTKQNGVMPKPAPSEVVTMRLSQDAYHQLENSLPKTHSVDNAIEAGFLLGIQHVLAKLRSGFTVSPQ